MAEVDLGILIPLIISIIIPFILLAVTRYFKASDTLSKHSVITEHTLKSVTEDLVHLKETRKEIWSRLETVEKSVFNICWRIEKVEQDHESRRME